MEVKHERKTGGSSTLNRALLVLEELANGRAAGMTAAQLADATRTNRVTVHRILTTFLKHGYVRQKRAGAPYRLGFRFVELGDRVIRATDLVQVAQPLLEELVARTGETSHMAVLDGAEAVYVAKTESPHSVRLVSRVGARAPLYCTSLGKAMLAAMPEPMRASLVAQQRFERRTETTLTDPDSLGRELEQVRRRGYAVDRGENEDGVRCVAAAILDRSGMAVAAVSVSGPASRISETRFRELGSAVGEVAAVLSQALGGNDGQK